MYKNNSKFGRSFPADTKESWSDTQRLNSIFLSSEFAALRLRYEITLKNDELKCIKHMAYALPQNLYLFPDHVVYLPDAKVDVILSKNSEKPRLKLVDPLCKISFLIPLHMK